MKKLFTVFSLFMMLLAFAACSEDDPQGGPNPPAIDPDELEVSVSPAEIIANGTDEAVLSVTYEGEDVTAQSKFFANGSELSGNRFTATEVGEYELCAEYMNVRSASVKLTAVEPAPEEVVLSADTLLIMANGVEIATFSAKQGEADVTAEAKFYVNGEQMEGHTFATKLVGDYEVHAVYDEVESNKLTLVAELKELLVKSSVAEIMANGKDKADFTVTYGGKDVTADSRLFVNGKAIEGNSYSTKEKGEFKVHAVYKEVETEKISVVADLKELLVKASKTEIKADNADETVFTVTYGGTDVTSKAQIFVNNEQIEGYRFKTDKEGTFEVHALYEGVQSAKATVTAKKSDDPYADFRRRCLVTQFTATWCQYCPRVIMGIHYFSENDAQKDDVVFAAAHSRDAMSNDFSGTLASYLRVNGYPSLKINFEDDVAQNTDPASAAKSIRTMTNIHLKTPANTGIAATVSQPDANGKITVDANIRVGKKGYYRVAAWVVEDGIIAAQADGIGYYEDLSTHNNVLRGSSSTSAQGDLISMKQLEARTTHNYKKTLDLELMGVKDYNKCRVVVVVTYNQTSNRFAVDNVISCKFGETRDFEYVR